MHKLLLAVLILFTSASFAQETPPPQKTDVETHELKGKVKTFAEVTWSTKEKFGDLIKDEKKSGERYEFNKAGFSTLVEYQYVLLEIDISVKFSYNSKGKIAESFTKSGNEKYSTKFTYNSADLLEIQDIYNNSGKLTSKVKRKYDDRGREISVITYNGDGSLSEKIIKQYSNGFNPSKITITDENDKLKEETGFFYNSNGNTTKELKLSVEDGKKKKSIESNWYNDKNQLTKRKKTSDGETTETTYEYDANGNVAKENESDGTITTYEYTYDDKKNWTYCIKKIFYGSTPITNIVEREIKYW